MEFNLCPQIEGEGKLWRFLGVWAKKQMGMDFLYDLRDALQSIMCRILRCYVG